MSSRLCACARHDRAALRTEGERAVAMVSGYFPEAIDVHANVVDLWASLEARLGCPDEARTLAWMPFLARPDTQLHRIAHKKYGWWEVQWGSIEKLREFYESLLSRKKNVLAVDQKVEVAQNWVSAEERSGDIVHEMHARRRLSSLQMEAKAQAAVAKNQEKRGQETGGKRKRGEDREAGTRKDGGRRETDEQADKKGKRTKHSTAAAISAVAADKAAAIAPDNNGSEGGADIAMVSVDAATAEDVDAATESQGMKSKVKKKKQKDKSGSKAAGEGVDAAQSKDAAPGRVFKDECTVFVQNLPDDVTEDDLKELFQVCLCCIAPSLNTLAPVGASSHSVTCALHGSLCRCS
jgi:hypothetical protein